MKGGEHRKAMYLVLLHPPPRALSFPMSLLLTSERSYLANLGPDFARLFCRCFKSLLRTGCSAPGCFKAKAEGQGQGCSNSRDSTPQPFIAQGLEFLECS